jgi:hypothetical protein
VLLYRNEEFAGVFEYVNNSMTYLIICSIYIGNSSGTGQIKYGRVCTPPVLKSENTVWIQKHPYLEK